MNWQPLEVQTYASTEDYLEKSARRHIALRRAERRSVVAPVIKAPPPVVYVHAFDAHVLCWREHLARVNGTPRDYIKVRCRELGFPYLDIIGGSRFRDHARIRQMLMWELNQLRPNLSRNQIGKEFGGRDHTTVLHALRAHQQRIDADGCATG